MGKNDIFIDNWRYDDWLFDSSFLNIAQSWGQTAKCVYVTVRQKVASPGARSTEDVPISELIEEDQIPQADEGLPCPHLNVSKANIQPNPVPFAHFSRCVHELLQTFRFSTQNLDGSRFSSGVPCDLHRQLNIAYANGSSQYRSIPLRPIESTNHPDQIRVQCRTLPIVTTSASQRNVLAMQRLWDDVFDAQAIVSFFQKGGTTELCGTEWTEHFVLALCSQRRQIGCQVIEESCCLRNTRRHRNLKVNSWHPLLHAAQVHRLWRHFPALALERASTIRNR